jgi:diguanylate cyclase (GGDEF)-like protein/PAS domain S-box-containing protein
MTGPASADPAWPRTAVVASLAAVAVVVGVQSLVVPEWNGHGGPAVLAAATLVVCALVVRHSRRLDPLSTATWRSFAATAALLALGHLVRAVAGVGVNPAASGLSDLPLAATGPIAVWLCTRLVRSTGGRIRIQVVLDAAVALAALGVLLEMLVPLATGRAGATADPLLTVGYPAVSAILVAAGLVTLGSVSAPRRPAAAAMLLCFASLAVTMASGALAVGSPSPVLDAVTTTAYLAMVAAATIALAVDPGPQARSEVPVAAVPLAGVVVSYCLGFGVLMLLLGGLALGRPIQAVEAITLTALMALTFVRTLVWAADGARLTRQVLRTEAYFRGLVHGAADLTIVLDERGQVTWASASGADGLTGPALTARDLEGKQLRDLVHEDDRHELYRALHPAADEDGRGAAFRLRGRDGSWHPFETARTTSSSGLPGELPDASSPPGLPVRRPAVRRDGIVLHLRDVAGRRSAELELERLAYTDYLTGLPNRARLMAGLAGARARVADGERASLLLLDLDGFKPVNDVAGHEAGDHLLVQVAARLRATVRDGDLVGRLGGDEFAVLVPDGIEEATGLAERIVAGLRDLHPTTGVEGYTSGVVFDVSGSVGVTELDPADDVSTTIRQADFALRAAKAAGKSCVRTAGLAFDSAMNRRSRLARDLPAALDQGQLRVVYQPIAGAVDRRVLGLEALVRWEHPVLGTVPPDEFIPLAEDDGLIVPLQRWVLERAATDAAALLADGWDVRMGVNVSVRHLQAGCLAPDVASALAATGLPPGNLILEITESVLLDARDRLESDLRTLRDMGCTIALDDFGRGYSSLAYLARLPVDILKMDREFIADIERDRLGASLVAGVVELGRALGMDVVAEGVETDGQLALLRGMGCRYLQGWLFGRPVPVTELRALLADFDPTLLDAGELPKMDTRVHSVGRAG